MSGAQDKKSPDLIELALLVLVESQDMQADARQAILAQWRMKSKAHAEAMERALQEWSLMGEITSEPLTMQQRAQLLGETVVARVADKPRHVLLGAGAATALAFVAVLFQIAPDSTDQQITDTLQQLAHKHPEHFDQIAVQHMTERGEQDYIQLSDGSGLWLNWNTEVLVAELGDEIHVDVVRGDALFAVSESSTQSLVVHAGEAIAYAPHTEFAIHSHSPNDAFFQVKRGRLTILGADSDQPTTLETAEQAYFEKGEGSAPTRGSIEEVAAWRDGQLVFDDRPLIEVLSALSHYPQTPLAVGQLAAPGDPVSATYELAAADEALLQLAEQYSLEVFNPLDDGATVRSIERGSY